MKKPKLTKGEWKVTHNNLGEVGISANGKRVVVEVEPNQEELANAKAISAVPDMLDALLGAKKAINNLPDESLGMGNLTNEMGEEEFYPYKHELLENINKALKKAGCQ